MRSILDPKAVAAAHKKMVPILEKVEKIRQTYLIFFLLMTGLAVTLFLWMIFNHGEFVRECENGINTGKCFGGIIMAYFLIPALPFIPVIKFSKKYKRLILPEIASAFGYEYSEDGDIVFWHLREIEKKWADKLGLAKNSSLLLGHYSDVKTEDEFIALDQENGLSFHEIKIEQGGNINMGILTFVGFLVSFDVQKKFDVPVYLRKAPRSYGEKLKWSPGALQRIYLEDVRFEKIWDVFSTDQIKARSILKPSFMESIALLSELYNNVPISILLIERTVFIAVEPTFDLFEPPSFFTDQRAIHNINFLYAQIELQHQVAKSLE